MSYPKISTSIDNYSQYNGKLKSLKLTPTQRKKLLNSHRQEEIKLMIIYKYLDRRGFYECDLKKNPLLQNIIIDFLQKEKLTEKNLVQLYDKLQNKIQNIDKIVKKDNCSSSQNIQPKQNQEPNKNEVKKDNNEIKNENNNIKEVHKEMINYDDQVDSSSEVDKKSLYKGNEAENEWSMIVKYRQKKYEEELMTQQQKEKQKKQNFKQELDKQLAQKRDCDSLKYQKDNALESQIKEYHSNQENQLSTKLLLRKQLLEEEKKARDQQFKDLNYRAKKQKKLDDELDRSLVQKAKDDLWKEQENMRKKKLEYQESLRKIREENENNKRNALIQEDYHNREQEIKALTEENEMLVNREMMKKNEGVFRESKIKVVQESVSQSYVKEKLEKLRLEEQNQIKYLKELEKKNREKQEIKRKYNEEQKELLRLSLEQQIKERNNAKRIEQELNRKQAEYWQKDIQVYHLEEEMKKLKSKGENMKTLEVIKKQIEEGQKKKELIKNMNDEELFQNKQVLKDIALKEDELKNGLQKAVISVKKHL